MQIIKEIRLSGTRKNTNDLDGEHWRIDARCVVRSNTYGSGLDFFDTLLDAARQTYPSLTREDCQIVQFGGQRYAGTFGIEFSPPFGGNQVCDGWQEIKELEMTR